MECDFQQITNIEITMVLTRQKCGEAQAQQRLMMGHANLLCIVPILTDDPKVES